MNKVKIAVIGGGYTGMVAALRLAQHGCEVTLLEKGEALGGLASSFTLEGAPLEKAYHHLFKTDTSIIGLARELGIHDKLLWHDSSVATYYKGKLYPFTSPADILFRFTALPFADRVRLGLAALYLQRTKDWRRLEHISAYEWMRRYAGRRAVEVIWEPLLRGKFDKYFDKVSMAWLWARLHIRTNSREPGGEKLGYFAGGFQVFTDALQDALRKHKVKIRTGVQIDALHGLPSGSPSTVYHAGHAGSSSHDANPGVQLTIEGQPLQHYDACVVTTPSYIFARMLEAGGSDVPKYLAQLRSTNYLGALLMVFSSEQKISDYYWHNINDVELPFLVFIHHTKLINRKYYNGKYVYYIGAYLAMDHPLFQMTDEELTKTWFASLRQIFPAFDAAQVRQKHILRLANAQHIVDTSYRRNMPGHRTPLRGVYLANFAQIYPEDRGTNYAVREGEQIAGMVAEDLLKFVGDGA